MQKEMTEEHPLAYTWTIWEHRNDCENYEDNISPVGEFDTVEMFWRYWYRIPNPGLFFFHEQKFERIDRR